MPLEHADLDPLRDDISQALKASARAETSAEEALRISKSNSNQLMGLAVSQQRTEAFAQRTEETLLDHKRSSETRHIEVMQAIEGAKANDKALADKQAVIESKLSNADVGKIAGAVVALIMAIVATMTSLQPYLPTIVQAKYGAPSVVVTVQPSPSAAPAGSK